MRRIGKDWKDEGGVLFGYCGDFGVLWEMGLRGGGVGRVSTILAVSMEVWVMMVNAYVNRESASHWVRVC